jgi:hypothetical protein
MRRAVEANGSAASLEALRGKVTIAELAESVTRRTIGGGCFNRSSPFGFYFEDVRALGFLRPPWGLAFEQLFERGMSTRPRPQLACGCAPGRRSLACGLKPPPTPARSRSPLPSRTAANSWA